MKKKLILVLLIVFLPIFVKGYEPVYCSKEDYEKVLGSVQKVVFAPEVVKSTKEYTDYKINSNVKRDDKIFIDTIIEVDKSGKVEYVEDTRTYRIYGKNGTKEKVTVALKLKPSHICYPEKLKNIDYDLLYINPYTKNKKCKVYPDFKYCGKNTYLDKDEKEVDKLFAAYAKEQNKSNSISTSNQKNNDKKKSILKHIIYFLKKNIVLILAGFILLIVIIMAIKSKKRKNLYSLLLIFLFPCIISASSSTSWVPAGSWTGTIKPCPKERQQAEIREWCNCTRTEVDAAKNPDNGNGGRGCGSYGTSGPARICGDCYGFCFGPGLTFDEDLPRVGINKETDFDQEFGSFCNGREYELPVKLPGYCCYYKGNRNSKYRYYNGPTNSRCKPNMVAIKIDDPTDCQNTTCDDYRDFKSQEQFCNEYADTAYNKDEAKKQCISQRYAAGDSDMRFCNLPISHTEKIDESCKYNSPSNGDHVFSATGRKKNSRVFAYQVPGDSKNTKIFLKENCEYEEDLEMRSSGSRYAFINTLTISNGRHCKYKIYNENNILRNLMATVFRPGGRDLSCEKNKYCNAIKKIKTDKLTNLLKGNKTDYKSDYTITGQKEGTNNVLRVTQPFQFKGEALKVQSKMLKAKDIGERLNTFGVYGAPTSNFERETTANTGVTMNMQVSCYSFPNNVLRPDGTCFPAYFADKGVKQVKSNATFSTSNGFLCGGEVNTRHSYKDNPPVERCPSDGSGSGSSSGHGWDSSSDKDYIGYSPYCEIVVHADKCGLNPSSNYFNLKNGYRAGLKINTKIKAVNYRISNNCVNRGDVAGYQVSTLKGTKSNTHIYGGVIDDKNNFYHCKKTILHEDCDKKNECKVSKSGDDYSVSGAGDMTKNGVYVRKGKPFLKHEYQASDSPKNLKMFRIYENKVNSKKSDHLKYYKDNNLVNMAEPGFRHSIYFMVCENNNCHNPKLCESPYEPGSKDEHDPKPTPPNDPKAPDCFTDLERIKMKNADAVKKYCDKNYAKEYQTDGTMEACLNKCYNPDDAANAPQIYRRIKYNDPFPNNRSAGWNWFGRENLIQQSAAFIKGHDPLWTITLRQSDSYSIRNSNRTAGYDPYYDLPELTGDPYQKFESNFLRHNLRDVKTTEK